MDSQSSSKHLICKKKALIDYPKLWSHFANKRHRYNRMDPDPDPVSDDDIPPPEDTPKKRDDPMGYMMDEEEKDEEPKHTNTGRIERDIRGNIKKAMSRSDWRKFWVDRLRKRVHAPHLTDKDIADALERSKRVFLNRRDEVRRLRMDPDLPPCFYWDKFQVAEWAGSLDLPEYIPIKEMLLSAEITGRRLVTLDATILVNMGIHELDSVKTITKAVREILGIPPPNALRALGRIPPLEQFLRVKVRTGIEMDKMTFKDFCIKVGIDYEGAKIQMNEGYKPMPDFCRVIIEPEMREKVNWIPVTPRMRVQQTASDDGLLSTSDGSSSSDGYLYDIPTVEQLVNNAVIRNVVISNILNDIVERVYQKLTAKEEHRLEAKSAKSRQKMADDIFKRYMATVYSDFSIFDPEDRLKFITIIAEELVEDVMRAREVLEDIDGLQKKIKAEFPEKDLADLQDAVGLYVQSIMPLVVSAALKQLKESSEALESSTTHKINEATKSNPNNNSGRNTEIDEYSGYSGSSESENEEKQVDVLYKRHEKSQESLYRF